MLFDLWESFLLINEGIDLVFSNLVGGSSPVSLSIVLVTLLLTFLTYLSWRSTDIPDLPPVPRPPYIIQISAVGGNAGSRQTIADVQLVNGTNFFDGNRHQNISRNQGTNTEQNNQPGSLNSPRRNVHARGLLGAHLQLEVPANNNRRRPGRTFFFGLFRRPTFFLRPVPAVSNAIRAQIGSPNVVVYHRVNVYHHHIHSHPGSNQRPQLSPSNSDSSPTHSHPVNSEDIVSQQLDVTNLLGSTEGATAANSFPISESTGYEGEASITNEQVELGQLDAVNVPTEILTNFNFPPNDNSQVPSSTFHTGTTVGDSSQNIKTQAPSTSSSNMTTEKSSAADQNSESRTATAAEVMADNVRFTIKFLNDTQMDVTSQLSENIADFKRRHFATEMSENKTVRLIFNGRVLDNDTKTLRDFGIFDQCVVHCLIVNRQQNQEQPRSGGSGPTGNTTGAQGDSPQGVRRVVGLPEPGMFFVAFIGIFLTFLWFICLHFGQHLFTQSAVVSLTVLTAIFIIGFVTCYLPLPTN